MIKCCQEICDVSCYKQSMETSFQQRVEAQGTDSADVLKMILVLLLEIILKPV